MTETIWKKFNQQLFGFIRSRVSSIEIAEDILQEVFVKIHKNIDKIKDQNKIESWIYQITRNTIIDHYRKKKIDTTELKFEESLPEEINDSKEDFLKCLKPFILKLPEKYKDILLKTTYNNITQKEYASQNDLAYSTTKSRLQRARIQLNKLFNDCCAIEADTYGNIISSKREKCTC